MAFNLGGGLAAFGGAVADFGETYALAQQKAELEMKKVALADQLATQRESLGRAESHGYAMEEQGAKLAAGQRLRDAQAGALETSARNAQTEADRRTQAIAAASGGGGFGDSYANAVSGVEKDPANEMGPNKLGSGARGPFQIMPGTWSDVRASNPNLNLPENMADATKAQHRQVFDIVTANNATALSKAGVDVTPSNLYLAHRFGADGAIKLVNADDNAPLADVLPPEWQKQNPDMRGQTVGGFKRLADERMQGVKLGGAPDLGRAAILDPTYAKGVADTGLINAQTGAAKAEAATRTLETQIKQQKLDLSGALLDAIRKGDTDGANSIQQQMDALDPTRSETRAKTGYYNAEADAKKLLTDAQAAHAEAVRSRDPDRIRTTRQYLAAVQASTDTDNRQLSAQIELVKQGRITVDTLTSKVAQLSATPAALSDDGKAQIASLQKQLDTAQAELNRRTAEADDMLRTMRANSPSNAGRGARPSGTSAPPVTGAPSGNLGSVLFPNRASPAAPGTINQGNY